MPNLADVRRSTLVKIMLVGARLGHVAVSMVLLRLVVAEAVLRIIAAADSSCQLTVNNSDYWQLATQSSGNKYYYVFLSPILREVASALCGVLFICAFVNI